MHICVFCGSGLGYDPKYQEAARAFGKLLAENSHTLVYGGGNIGLMGTLADSVLSHGGQVIGVIPDFLMQREVGHQGITKLEVVGSMHERKKRMAELSNAFVAMPGGWGTLDELAEILTWRQLGLVAQPVAILNIDNFFQPLLDQMNTMVKNGFLKPSNLDFLIVSEKPSGLLSALIP